MGSVTNHRTDSSDRVTITSVTRDNEYCQCVTKSTMTEAGPSVTRLRLKTEELKSREFIERLKLTLKPDKVPRPL